MCIRLLLFYLFKSLNKGESYHYPILTYLQFIGKMKNKHLVHKEKINGNIIKKILESENYLQNHY